MPDFKCADCRIRVRIPGGDEAVAECPRCLSPLDPVNELSELVGFRSMPPDGMPVDRRPAERFADAVDVALDVPERHA
jgi:hypothetical protein